MAKVEGLNLRGSRWYLRIIIPDDLKDTYEISRVNLSLGTSDRKAAVVLATIKRAEWLAEFEQKRLEQSLTPVDAVSLDLADMLAQMVRAQVLATDDELRQEPGLWADMAAATGAHHTSLLIPSGAPSVAAEDALRGLDVDGAEVLAGFNAFLDGRAAVAMAGRNLTTVLPLVQVQAQRLGLSIDPKAPGVKEALLRALQAFRKAHQEKVQRDAGDVVETPVVALPSTSAKSQPTAKPRTLRDVFDRWKTSGEKERSADSVVAMDRTLRQFEGQHPSVPIESITREMGDGYRTWLRAACKTSKTASDRLTGIKSLLKYATDTLQWVDRHAWRGLNIKVTTENPRRPWSPTELQTLFAAPLHTAHELPTSRNAGGDAAYWIILLGLYTGARLGELCQLQTRDVKEIEGMPVIVITDEGERQKIKSDAGRRTIPIHSELIRLGFLDYVATVQKSREVSLWPALPLRKDKPSDFFGRWFLDHRKALGLTGIGEAADSESSEPTKATDWPTFHYFRHTVRPLMRRAGFSGAVQDRITGHETRGSIGDTVYDHVDMNELRPAVEAIQFPFLKLEKVWKS